MQLRQLRAFVVVAEDLHFTRAAARLFMTQSSLSRIIQELERDLDAQLFDRSANPIRLTSDGRSLLADARRILDMVDRTTDRFRNPRRTQARIITIGYAPYLHFHLLNDVITRFCTLAPDVDVQLKIMPLAELEHGLANHTVDLGFNGTNGIDGETLGSYTVIAALPLEHPLAAKPVLARSDFHHQPLVTLESNGYPSAKTWLKRHWPDPAAQPKVVQVVYRFEDMVGIISSGLAAGLAPEYAAMRVASSRIALRPFDPGLCFHMKMCWRPEETRDPELALFLSLVRDAVRDADEASFFTPAAALVGRPPGAGMLQTSRG